MRTHRLSSFWAIACFFMSLAGSATDAASSPSDPLASSRIVEPAQNLPASGEVREGVVAPIQTTPTCGCCLGRASSRCGLTKAFM